MSLPGCIGWGECRLECHQPEPHCSNCGRTWREHETSGIDHRSRRGPSRSSVTPAHGVGGRSPTSVDTRNERSPDRRAVPMALGDVSTSQRYVPSHGRVQARAGSPGRSFLVSTSSPRQFHDAPGALPPDAGRSACVAVCRTGPHVRQSSRSVPRTISGSRPAVRRQRSAEAHAIRSEARAVLLAWGSGELQASDGREPASTYGSDVACAYRRETVVPDVYVFAPRLMEQGARRGER